MTTEGKSPTTHLEFAQWQLEAGKNKKIRVLVGTPSWGTAPPECCTYREAIWRYLGMRMGAGKDYPYVFDNTCVSDQVVQYSREAMCRAAVQGKYDYIAMMDDDMLGKPDIWERLLAHNVDICAPLMFMRGAPHNPVVYALRTVPQRGSAARAYGTWIVRNYPKDQLFECDAVGFGAVMIKVEVLRRIPEPWFYVTNMDRKGNTGEDVYFCVQARQAGFRVFCDSTTHLLHLGPRQYIGEPEYEKANPHLVEMREAMGDWSREKQQQGQIA